jgi:hypothetical protein
MNGHPYAVYVNLGLLNTLSGSSRGENETDLEQRATSRLWRRFLEDRIKCVTSREDTRIDVILYLNRQGCCVTDTLAAAEAIREFERWGMVDRGQIEAYRRLLAFSEQLHPLSPYDSAGQTSYALSGSDKELLVLIRDEVLRFDSQSRQTDDLPEEDSGVLEDCLKDLRRWYSDESWRDLRKTDYALNWSILESVLPTCRIDTIPGGTDGERVRNLFGLLNRAVGLSKKSCGRLPLPESHVAFVIRTVTQRYHYRKEERDALHIFHCIRHGISRFVSTDSALIDRYKEKSHLLSRHPLFLPGSLQLVRPSVMESVLARGD